MSIGLCLTKLLVLAFLLSLPRGSDAARTREYKTEASRPMTATECGCRITVNQSRGQKWKVWGYYGGKRVYKANAVVGKQRVQGRGYDHDRQGGRQALVAAPVGLALAPSASASLRRVQGEERRQPDHPHSRALPDAIVESRRRWP